ncbi:hypothetical protein ACFFGH_03550 [Lysobacter korlensis]|uniref:DUF2569 domain-containing protein n=1 Tax=Lysobacter korlensis TaxID=553636 RepID=A0ABV6RLS8_9GAMM
MGEHGSRGGVIRAAIVALCAVYLVPLTLVSAYLTLMLPAAFPLGWPGEARAQFNGGFLLALQAAFVGSVIVGWNLALGSLRGGWAWVRSRSRLLQLAGLFAPVYLIYLVAKSAYRAYHFVESGGAGEFTALYAAQLPNYGYAIAWSLLCLALLALMRKARAADPYCGGIA